MNELAKTVYMLVSNPTVLRDAAQLKATLQQSGISPAEKKALAQVLQSFDWQKVSMSEALTSMSVAGDWTEWFSVA